MKRMTGSRWRVGVAGFSLAAAVAIGGTLAMGDAAPGTAATQAAPSAADKAAAQASFRKARELMQAGKFDDANAEAERGLALDPQNSDGIVLRDVIRQKIAESGTPSSGPAGPHLLKPSDIALLQVSEWSSDDTQARGRIDHKVLQDFWKDDMKKVAGADLSRDAENKFLNSEPSNFPNQVQAIRDSGDPKYMDKVDFTSDPAAFMTFKKTVEPYVLQNCATAACHAGDKAGNFKLYRPGAGTPEQVIYTNFYILAMYANKDGKMIDHDKPDQSLLLQYGMIKAAAAIPHPGKAEVRYFTDKTDPKFKAMSDWIDKQLRFPRPNYGIVYELPGAAPATAPAAATQAAPHPVAPAK